MLPLHLGAPSGVPLSVLAIGAHPDDIEIGAGGLLLALAQGRPNVRYVVLTGTADRHQEARSAARSFLPDADLAIDLFDLPEGRLPTVWADVKEILEGIARSCSPDVIIAPSAHDAHQDHRTVAEIVPTVFRDQLYLAYEIPKWDGDIGRPSVYVPLSAETARRKVELLHKCFPSQRSRDWWDDEVFLGLARLRGMECRAPYAEAFTCTKSVIVPVPSVPGNSLGGGPMKSFAASNAYVSAVHDLIPGGAHTYAKGDDQYPDGMAPVIERGSGCRVWDIDGNEYVEFGSGLRSNLLGHGFEPVVRAARGWLEDGLNFVRPHRIELQAAERLTELIPSAEMVKFGLNGSDATTAAVRLARAYTGREKVAVCRDQPFFSTDDWFIVTTPMSAGIPEATRHLTVQFSYNDLADLERLFDAHPGQIAAVVMEAETVQPPAAGYFDGLRRLCDRNGALLILDEMITGFRWHERGAQFVHGIEPDLCTFGKGLANGFPVSALAGRRDVMRLGGFADDADRVFLLSQTAGAQPWALAAMLAAIDSCQQDRVAERLLQTGGELRRGIEEVVAAAGLSSYFQIRGRDCNLVYVARDQAGQPSQAFRTLVLQELIQRGILAPSFVVCAAHDPAAIGQTLDAVSELMPVYQRALESGIEQVLRGRPVRPANRARG